ncbi:MAG: hypothetical protein ACXWRE_02880 [Pseudobdellovibrionaceae bacterium]
MKSVLKFLFIMAFLSLSFKSSGLAQDRCENILASQEFFNNQESWTLQSLQSGFKVLNDFFIKNKNLSDEEKVQALMNQDLRKVFFRFEALSHMLAEQNPKFFTKKRVQFKALEDSMGRLDLANSLLNEAIQVGQLELIQFFSQQQAQAARDLVTEMQDAGFWNEPEETLSKLKEKFENKGHWKTGKDEKKFLISNLAEYSKALHKAVKDNEFDKPEIEKGLHELRRRLRWLVIQVSGLEGLVEYKREDKLSDDIQSWFNEMQQKNPQILESKYLSKKKAQVDHPLEIPLYEISMISELVAKIGDLKDDAEMQIYFARALDQLNFSSSEKSKVLGKLNHILNVQEVDHQALAREIQAKLAKSKLLKKYAKKLEEVND